MKLRTVRAHSQLRFAPIIPEDLRKLGRLERVAVMDRLNSFWTGGVTPELIETLLCAPREPPWRLLRLPRTFVIIRRLSEEELLEDQLTGPTLLVARIVTRDRLQEALDALAADSVEGE